MFEVLLYFVISEFSWEYWGKPWEICVSIDRSHRQEEVPSTLKNVFSSLLISLLI